MAEQKQTTPWQAAFPDWLEERRSRGWWPVVYRAGIDADLNKRPRVPPDHLSIEQQEVWLMGYDR